ncbi:malonyl CoA-ACP transacylase, partial [Priestia megaterium]|nr:malonyl CoA-ACP transacylase [Priestia megaterium]
SGFVKKVDRSVKTISITTADELRQAIEELGR